MSDKSYLDFPNIEEIDNPKMRIIHFSEIGRMLFSFYK